MPALPPTACVTLYVNQLPQDKCAEPSYMNRTLYSQEPNVPGPWSLSLILETQVMNPGQ